MAQTKALNDARFLELLQKVLPKAVRDPVLVTKIYEEVAREVRLVNHLQSFEKFCAKGSLPDLEPETISELQEQLASNFGGENVLLVPDEEEKSVAVEINLPDVSVSSRVRVIPPGTEEEEVQHPFVPFPICLPEDPELVWMMGRRENFSPEEAARSLALIEDEFWNSKKGCQLQRSGMERTFADFIDNVPASALTESGLKRHYKIPETLRGVRRLTEEEIAARQAAAETSVTAPDTGE